MFEFHGWVNIKADDTDDAEIDILDARLNGITAQIENRIEQFEWPNCILRVFRGLSGENHLLMTGFQNHRDQDIIDLFRWIAARQPFSYGLLHIRDDEDKRYKNVFRVFSMTSGKIECTTEKLLSPCVPKIEPEWKE